jgi:hypothetical protein
MLCGPGTYSTGGATLCSQCPPGVYGSTSGLTSSACSGPCPAGRACPVGTVYPTVCPPGTFSASGASTCSACPLAAPYSAAGAKSSSSCSNCTGASGCGDGLQGKILSITAPACTNSLASWTLWIDKMVWCPWLLTSGRCDLQGCCFGYEYCPKAPREPNPDIDCCLPM